MKKILFLLITLGTLSATAQNMAPQGLGGDGSMWTFEGNVLLGSLRENLTTANSTGNYPNGVNVNQGNLTFGTSGTVGIDVEAGWFPGKHRHWGIGTGIMYLRQHGYAVLDSFHAEYQATDSKGNIYRQVVTSDGPVEERLKIVNVNIPLVAKYKTRLSEKWGFSADAGLLFNLQMTNRYNTDASFDYEAIYKYSEVPGGLPTVYDNSPTPGTTDYLITKAGFLATNLNGNLAKFFNDQRALGYNVGLGVKPNNNSGSVSYNAGGSGGILLRPSFNYYFSDNLAFVFGLYYIYQYPHHNVPGDYTLTKGMGDYSSVLNNVTKSHEQSFGFNIGIRFSPGKKRAPFAIASQDAMDPTICGLADGMITLRGLRPGEPVTVNYTMNGTPRPPYTSTVMADGTIKITELTAGAYSDITVASGRKKVTGTPVNLVNPQMYVMVKSTTNPSAMGACDGSITLSRLLPGKYVTVDYDLNGAPQSPNAEMVQMTDADGTMTLKHLCAGVYSHIVAKINGCAANATDLTLKAPAPPPPPPSVYETIDTSILSSSIYFDPNKRTITATSRPTVDYAASKLIENKEAYIVVTGYADNSGNHAKNMELSIKRAEAVKAELIRMGVDEKHIKVAGKGEKDPIGDNKTPEGRAKNRRAVLTLDIVTMSEHTR
jgi:outer membrane protein OmpA-like peptidoglycan-associated protein